MRALVIGGTGPTGPQLVHGLEGRGYTVTILHTGRHEVEGMSPSVEHVHTDPFDVTKVADALGSRAFDVVYAMYGRLRDLAPFFVGRCGHFLAVGGVPVYRGYAEPWVNQPPGLRVPTREDAPRAADADNVKVQRITESEDRVFSLHPDATTFRYPQIYGPGQLIPREWIIVRRILDGRRRVIVADGGLSLRTTGYGPNVGHALTLAAGADVARGKAYNVGDEHLLTAGETIAVIAGALGAELEQVSLPAELATPARPFLCADSPRHVVTGVDAIMADLGYRDLLPAPQAIAATARWLVDNPVERGSFTEQRLQDPFDYEAEDRIIDAYRRKTADVAAMAAAYDPEYRDRYAPGSDDWRLVPPRS